MLEDLFLRIPYENLAAEADNLRRLSVNPEIYINGEILSRLTPRQCRRKLGLLRSFSAHTIHAPFLDISPGGWDADIRQVSFVKMARIMEIAATWQARLVVMHFNYDPIYYQHSFSAWLERAADFYSRLLACVDGIPVALENIAEPDPEIQLQLMRRINHPAIVPCFDFGHHHVFGKIPFSEWLDRLGPQPHIHFHLHDNPGNRDDHLPLGRGTIAWTKAKERLLRLDNPFTIALEPHSHAGAAQALDFYRRIFLTAG